MNSFVNIFTDGGARGNPGLAAIGVCVTDSRSRQIAGFGKKIGFSTNNIAEYRAVLEGLGWIVKNKKKLKILRVFFFLDSLLVYSQITGLFKVKNANLRRLLFSIREKEAQIKIPIFYKHISREGNKEADSFVNAALDSTASALDNNLQFT